MQAESSAVSNIHRAVMEGIAGFAQAGIFTGCGRVDLGGTLHIQRFVRTFGIELGDEVVELRLLLQAVHGGWPRRFFLEGKMHAFMPAVLLRMDVYGELGNKELWETVKHAWEAYIIALKEQKQDTDTWLSSGY